MSVTRVQLANLALSLGIPRLSDGNQARLLTLNYHRLRPATPGWRTLFDDGVFDTDVTTFRRQMEWLRKETIVLDEAGLIRLALEGGACAKRLYSVVTFDDGYIDCIERARPVLDELGIRAIFFLPVELLESRRLGWWDLSANLLKRTARKRIDLEGVGYDLEHRFEASLRAILNRFKLEPFQQTSQLLQQLAAACDVPVATAAEQGAELMSWADVKELQAAGHGIGAHSLTHRVLATLDTASQAREIRESGRQLEAILGRRMRSFAYPVGGPQHINADSVRLAREAGYDLAFTFNTGTATLPLEDRFQVPRESARSLEILQAKALFPSLMRMQRRLPFPAPVGN